MTHSDTVIRKNNCTARLIEENIYFNKFDDNILCTILDFQQGYDAFTELSQGKPMKVIVELGLHTQATPEAREFAQANELPAIAEALVINSLGQRMLVNFYIRFKKLKHPTKVFKDLNSALVWIKKL